jgi:hypothetical protein
LWSGSKGVTCKKHRREKNSLRRSPPCFRRVRRAYRALPNSECGIRNFYFFFPIPHSALCIPHFNCPPGPRKEGRLMVFARNALASGPGNAWNSIHLPPTWRKVKGQVFFSFFLNPTPSCDKNL